MRQAARAIIIRDSKLAVVKRNKFGSIYYILVGGGVDPGETPEQAVRREVEEETGMRVVDAKLAYIEDAAFRFGRQYIYLCDAEGDSMSISADTQEHQLNIIGKNTYKPMWLPLDELERVTFRSEELKQALLDG